MFVESPCDKAQADSNAFGRESFCRAVEVLRRTIDDRLEAQAVELLEMGVPLTELERLIWPDCREEIVARRTDYLR